MKIRLVYDKAASIPSLVVQGFSLNSREAMKNILSGDVQEKATK